MAFAIFNALVVLLEQQFYWFFFSTRNPFSQSYSAIPSGLPRLGKFALKLVPAVFFGLELPERYINLYVILIVLLHLAYLYFLRLDSIHSFNSSFFNVELVFEGVCVWFHLNAALCLMGSSEGIPESAFIHSLLCGGGLGALVYLIESSRSKKFLMKHLNLKLSRAKLEALCADLLERLEAPCLTALKDAAIDDTAWRSYRATTRHPKPWTPR